MKEVKFNEIWDTVIKPYLNAELSSDSSLQSLDITGNSSKARRDIESLYDVARATIKAYYMKDAARFLDRHKVPACIYIAMVNAPLIKVLGGTNEKDAFVNACLAFYVASSILLSFMADCTDAAYSQFLQSSGLQYPPVKNSDSGESYMVQTIKGLCYAQKNKQLNPITLANIFCLLESNTDLVYASGKK
ncbi:MAG: hypothetical protein LBC64_08160 [Fibromonadaceae bacterium]|jgi:hypothetical protein|nr:hypothetical protein [Fibromonadaceae bacterium]